MDRHFVRGDCGRSRREFLVHRKWRRRWGCRLRRVLCGLRRWRHRAWRGGREGWSLAGLYAGAFGKGDHTRMWWRYSRGHTVMIVYVEIFRRSWPAARLLCRIASGCRDLEDHANSSVASLSDGTRSLRPAVLPTAAPAKKCGTMARMQPEDFA